MLGTQGLWAGRDLYRGTPTATRGLDYAVVLRKATRNVRKLQLIYIVNTAPLYTTTCSYWVTVHVFRTAGISLVDLVTCLILSLNIDYKSKQTPALKRKLLSVEAINTTDLLLYLCTEVYTWRMLKKKSSKPSGYLWNIENFSHCALWNHSMWR
jgi:hypothetical protein